jgi:hypothetical protein
MHNWKDQEWSIRLEIEDLEHIFPEEKSQAVAYAFLEALSDHAPAVSVGSGEMSVRFFVRADSPWQAIKEGMAFFDKGALRADIPRLASHITKAEAWKADTLRRWVAKPDSIEMAKLVGVAEVAEILGVTRQRASEISRKRDFPAPLTTLAATPIWLASSVERFAEDWIRRPGRPKRRHPAEMKSSTSAENEPL